MNKLYKVFSVDAKVVYYHGYDLKDAAQWYWELQGKGNNMGILVATLTENIHDMKWECYPKSIKAAKLLNSEKK